MQLTAVTEDLVRYLAGHSIEAGSAPWAGMLRAIGVGPGEQLSSEANPVYGFYLQTLALDPARLELFVVTGGRLVRYEWSPAGEFTATVPLDRVASVEEQVAGTTMTLSVLVDSSVSVAAGRASTRTGPDPESVDDETVGTVEWTSRREGLVYRLTAGGDEQNPGSLVTLAGFSRALRLLLGA